VPGPVSVVNVFRAPEALPGIAREAVAIHGGALWYQFGVINADSARIAEDGGATSRWFLGLTPVTPLGFS
jgi:uncharacterized protein